MSVTADLKCSLTIDETVAFVSSQVLEGKFTAALSYVAGAAAVSNGVNVSWTKAGAAAVTLASAATVTYTLTALTDALGRSATFAGGVRGLWIRVTSRTAGDYLTVGAAGTNPWTSMFGGTTPTIKVFKFLCVAADLTDEYAVTASSNEQLKITNSGSNSITFEIGLIGCSS